MSESTSELDYCCVEVQIFVGFWLVGDKFSRACDGEKIVRVVDLLYCE
jgi:hypothetical protein